MTKDKAKNTEIPGNSVGSHAAYLRQMVRQAEALLDLERTVEHMFEEEWHVRGITIRFPQDDRPEYLAIVRLDGRSGKQVAFHNAPTLLEVIVGVANRLKNRSLQFKDDKYE